MPVEGIQKIVSRAIMDRHFREQLFTHPEEAAKEYNLSGEEVSSLKKLTRDKFDAAAAELEKRVVDRADQVVQQKNGQVHFDLGRIAYMANCY